MRIKISRSTAHAARQLPAHDAPALRAVLDGVVASALSLSLPFALAARHAGACAATGGDVVATALSPLPPLCALLLAHSAGSPPARRATLASGSGLLRAAGAAAFAQPLLLPTALSTACELCAPRGGVPGPVALGLVVGLLGGGPGECGAALAHAVLRDAASAAVRLGLAGPLAAAGAHAAAAARAAPALATAVAAAEAERSGGVRCWGVAWAAPSNPLADCLQAGHGELHARLFQS